MSAAAVMEIYLVRHGETDWNRAQRLQGTIDTPLNRIGVAQAHQLADRFRALAVSAVVTSPLARARITARAIARGSHSAFVVDPLLAEIDHGSWAGLTIPTIARTSPGAVTNSQLQPEALDVSGGETLAAAYDRASAVLRRLVAASPAAPVVVVSHGVINALLICAAVGNVPAHMDQYTQPNGCTYRLRFRRRVLVTVECTPLVALLPDAATRCSFPRRVTS
jgi:broad specificity phosphatase PhoE